MKKLAATLFLTIFAAIAVFGQAPTLTIVTETSNLPSELWYGPPPNGIKVKPVRLRPGTNTVITIADYDFFIQQQYIDMLRRFPETVGNPMQFYLDLINGYLNSSPCTPTNVTCINSIRGIVGANFFRSPEFQRKGNYVMYLYMVSIGQRPKTVAELPTKNDPLLNNRPHYTEFFADLGSISTPNDDPALTNAKKDALAVAWLQRTEIQNKYGSLSNDQFVKTLESTAGVTLSNEGALINSLNTGTSRASVLRTIVESSEVNAKFYQQAYVTMEYFGYLRRDPEDCHNSSNWSDGTPSSCGFIFHNNRFNDPNINPAHIQNIMLQGFIESPEYINRF